MLARWFRKKISSVFSNSSPVEQELFEKRYYQCLQASRSPVFYTDFDVQDNFDGRFDMLCIVTSIFMYRLSSAGVVAKQFNQDLFDAMFFDIDLTLREMGAGDLGVGKRVKLMSESFVGRLDKYSKALSANDSVMLSSSVARNLYRRDTVTEKDEIFAKFIIVSCDKLATINTDVLMGDSFDMNVFMNECVSAFDMNVSA